jgi:hypothetical protein
LAKVDKSQLTKEEWKKLKEFRKREKEISRLNKERAKTLKDIRIPVVEQTPPLRDHSPVKSNNRVVNKTPVIKASQLTENSKIGFVLGNGTSRKPVDLNTLKEYGTIYGCNALYREFDPDYLVAVDVKMVLELHNAGYEKRNHNIWTNPNKSLLKYPGFNFFNPSKGWSSGPTTLWLASQHKYDIIYILGFDYRGLQDGQKFNNIYADTFNYKKSTDSATFFGNWMRQTSIVIKDNPKIQYVRVIAPDNYRPAELNNFENFSTMMLDEFQSIFKKRPE